MSLKRGADLRYGCEVKNINHETKEVELTNGEIFRADKNIVISCGAVSNKFYI